MRPTRTAALAAAGIVGSGVVGGLTYAAVSAPATASTPAAQPAATTAAPASATAAARRAHRLLARLEHGELTVRTRAGDRTIDLQRGAVTAVSASSVTVKSHDGFTSSYDVTPRTRVRTHDGRTTIATVHVGDRVLVVATGGKALRIRDR